jgi:hypothetical protein
MNIEVFSHSKYKIASKPGDDMLLIIPDKVYAVFDGATDPTGASYNGESSGRFAARIAAQTVAHIAMSGDVADMTVTEVLAQVSNAVSAEAIRMQASHPPSTTAAVVFDLGDHYRLMMGGDTGIRINGHEVHQYHKLIDTVSTAARVSVFTTLLARGMPGDEAEMTTRSIIFGGVADAVSRGVLSVMEAEASTAAATLAAGLEQQPDIAREFVMGGIRTQQGYANRADHVLGFASLNGKNMILDGIADFTLAKTDVTSLEIFSDGYLSLPQGVRVADWEDEFARVEALDFHKTGAYPAVKGSTSLEFCDDRTIVSIFRP